YDVAQKTVATLAKGAGLELRACRDLEPKKPKPVNKVLAILVALAPRSSASPLQRARRPMRSSGFDRRSKMTQQNSLGWPLPLSANSISLAHKVRVPDNFYRIPLRCVTSNEQRKAIDQASPTPVH